MVILEKLRDKLPDLSTTFSSAQPFKHIVLDNFFEATFCNQLLAEFPAFDSGDQLNESGERGRKSAHNDLSKLGSAFHQFDQIIKSEKFLKTIESITGVKDLIYDPDYIGGGTHENLTDQELDLHVDFNLHPITKKHRRLNVILFLNETWDPKWGGCLELVESPYSISPLNKTIDPIFNRLVIFETNEKSWHGFEKINIPADADLKSRKSIAIYYYTKDRPKHETTDPHTTVYVNRQLPSDIQEGTTLTDVQFDQISNLIQRRDQHLKFVYDREKFLSAQVKNLEDYTEYLKKLILEGFLNIRHLAEIISAEGWYPDRWIGPNFSLKLKLRKEIKSGLQISCYSPFPTKKENFFLSEVNDQSVVKTKLKNGESVINLHFSANEDAIVNLHISANFALDQLQRGNDSRDLSWILLYVKELND